MVQNFKLEFEKKVFEPFAQYLVRRTDETLHRDEVSLKEAFFAEFDELCYMAKQKQNEGMLPPIGYITLSVLYTSVYFKKPCLQVDFYDKDWFLKDALYSTVLPLEWLFVHWDDFRQKINRVAEQERSRIKQPYVEKLFLQTVRILCYIGAAHLKYWLRCMEKQASFSNLVKLESCYITFGEYYDWQDVLYAQLPEIDLADLPVTEGLQFRVFQDKKYKNLNFKSLDLQQTKFINCLFEACSFVDVNLSDAVFDRCIFASCVFDKVHLCGTICQQTQFFSVDFKKVFFEWQEEEIFRTTEFRRCVFSETVTEPDVFADVVFDQCNVRDNTGEKA